MKDVSTKLQFNAVISKPVALIKFSAEWCGPCKAVAPAIDKLAVRYPSVECGAVDIDKAQDIAREYDVSAVPTFIFFKDGKPVDVIKGGNVSAVQATFAKLAATTPQMPKSGGNTLSSGTQKPVINQAFGNQFIGWAWIYLKSLFSLNARAP